MICQATISAGKFTALDTGAPWCPEEAVTTVTLALVQPRYENEGRNVNVWLCQEHAEEYMRSIDL